MKARIFKLVLACAAIAVFVGGLAGRHAPPH